MALHNLFERFYNILRSLFFLPTFVFSCFIVFYCVLLLCLYSVLGFDLPCSKEGLVALFPADLNPKLKPVLASVISNNLAAWTGQTINLQVSLPRLKSFDWRIDIKTASDGCAQMSQPTCLVQMQVRTFTGNGCRLLLNILQHFIAGPECADQSRHLGETNSSHL